MKQTAVVSKILSGNMAEVTVTRKSACSGDCEKCHGCVHPEEKVNVSALNAAGAGVGDRVIVESATSKIMKAIALFYLLPIVLMVAVYFIVGGSEGVKILCSLAGLAAGIFICWIVYNKFSHKNSISFTITEILR